VYVARYAILATEEHITAFLVYCNLMPFQQFLHTKCLLFLYSGSLRSRSDHLGVRGLWIENNIRMVVLEGGPVNKIFVANCPPVKFLMIDTTFGMHCKELFQVQRGYQPHCIFPRSRGGLCCTGKFSWRCMSLGTMCCLGVPWT